MTHGVIIRYSKGYEIAIFFGGDPTIDETLTYRLNHVNFEDEQTFKTYLYRFFGNMLIW